MRFIEVNEIVFCLLDLTHVCTVLNPVCSVSRLSNLQGVCFPVYYIYVLKVIRRLVIDQRHHRIKSLTRLDIGNNGSLPGSTFTRFPFTISRCLKFFLVSKEQKLQECLIGHEEGGILVRLLLQEAERIQTVQNLESCPKDV